MLAIITSSRIVPAGLLIVSVVVVVPACAAARNAIPASPSVTLTLLIDTDGSVSLSTIVPVPTALPIVAPEALASVTRKVSVFSTIRSPITGTTIGCVTVPAGKLSMPLVAV